ncbi:SARP family transcriptional regulator [Actinoplanes lobatus]|uniref:Putative ATPase/DNA-binding SARP family transcriptional activator n=1 Tax=Actinoplanes lobatus TaxID=113568 RepID=A0A7W7MJK4_9ACTN|nr:BTAD domain-containing putative transcriptional regulator [Actinoplanes lobatus]MBB4752747.1 putative ATPase/DNA-binding SARP family transcriptional activator [Actinoplanes lobatus]GGN90822.1 SARP family transcriptional regulator [Actinoplanes lobatus]GIE43916.1 SARP family transcriptional regulator [Actinoplanes lobatus]
MRFGILGATAAWRDDGTAVAVGGPASRALLALLLARPGQVVTTHTLIDDLYGDRAPGDAGHALQSRISRLRRALAPVTIDMVPSGYRLSADADDIDAGRFERLADAGRRALADGQAEDSAAVLADALALWRGDVLADVPDAPSVRALAHRLEERRLGAVEDLLEARLRLGGQHTLVADLRELVAGRPLRERPQGLLLRALAAAGEPAQALAAYAEYRRHLADELGADPSAELEAIHLSLLTGPVTAASPAPARLTSFVGRDEDLHRVGELLGAHRLVTLYGPGGVGKTRLAAEVAAARPDVCFVALDPLHGGPELAAAILAALGLRESGPHAPPVARLIAALAAGPTLLVLDNCEHLVQAVAELAEQILTHCPRTKVLATSREPLRITGEHLWPVPTLDEAAAVRLFADRAAAVHPGFTLDRRTAGAVGEICRRLDGLPLAIELAAARVRTVDVADIAVRLSDRFALLSRGSRTAPARHRTLRAAVAWSWDLLTDTERTALRRLSVFAGGADPAAAARICAVPDIAEVLESLVDKSLLRVAGNRYLMLDTVTAYADERLAEADESIVTRDAHAGYFLALATSADPHLRGPQQLTWLRILGAEHENLHAALRWSVTAGDIGTALRLLAALATYLWMRGTRTVAGDLANAVLDEITDGPPPGLENEYVLCVLAAAASSTGRAAYERHIAAARSIAVSSPRPLHPVTTFLRSMVGWGTDPEVHTVLVRRGLTSTDPWEAAAAHLVRGYQRLFTGADPVAAQREFVMAAEGFRTLGERWGQALALGSLAGLADIRADHGRAVAYADEALVLLRELGAVEELCDLYCDRGQYRVRLAVATGADPSAARADFEAAERMAQRAGLPGYVAIASRGLADVAYLAGDLGPARRHYERALADGDVRWIAGATNRVEAMVGLARVAVTEGELDRARADGLRAAELAVMTGMPPLYVRAVDVLTDVALAGGDAARAASLLGAAAALRGPAEAGPGTARQERVARLALGDEAFERFHAGAARLDQGAALRLVGVAPEVIAGSPAVTGRVSVR